MNGTSRPMLPGKPISERTSGSVSSASSNISLQSSWCKWITWAMKTVAVWVPPEGCDRMETNPVKAIRKFCLECCGGSSSEVKHCSSINCNLHPFRFGKNPYRAKRELTEEQKKAAKARLAEARAKKGCDQDDD